MILKLPQGSITQFDTLPIENLKEQQTGSADQSLRITLVIS